MLKIHLEKREAMDLSMISRGLLKPLRGFMGKEDIESVRKNGRLKDGFPFTMEITLKAKEGAPDPGDMIKLVHGQETLGTMKVKEVFELDGSTFIGGDIEKISTGPSIKDLKGWKRVSGMVTYHPYFRFVEYAVKSTLEMVDGVLIAVPAEGGGKIPKPSTRIRATQILFKNYLPGRTFHIEEINYHGRNTDDEIVVFAVILKNMGCDIAILIPQDKEGFIKRNKKLLHDIGVESVVMDVPFYCKKCGGMATEKTCPHPKSHRTFLDMERATTLMRRGTKLPEEYVRPEVAKALVEGFLFGGG